METLFIITVGEVDEVPHSLGKLVEWKRFNSHLDWGFLLDLPHSLGKLVEWKHTGGGILSTESNLPHSLGKLVEWKQRNIG